MNALRLLTGGALALALSAGFAQAAEVTLTVHHFLSPKSIAQTKLIEPWAQAIEAQSNGRIEVEIFPSMSMGGKPPELYRQVRDGAADVVWTLIGYTPGVFPRSEVFELPTVHRNSAEATTLAIQDVFELIAPDYDDLKVLLVHVHAGNALHMRDTKVGKIADLDNLKLRTPSRTGAWMIEAFGAEPVGMPLPALPEALSKGTVDGALIPFEIFPPFKLQDLTKYSIVGPDDTRFGTSVFLFAMNKERYEQLPDDLKAVIDDTSGMALAEKAGAAWDEAETPGEAAQIESGGEIVTLTSAAMAPFQTQGETVVERWTTEMADQNIDGDELVKAAREAIAKHSFE